MLPRLGARTDLAIEVITKTRSEYQTLDYAKLGLPKAPAIMIDDDVIVEGQTIDERELENLIELRKRAT